MTVSVLLRLARDAIVRGRLAGDVEVVESGRRTVVRNADELVAFLRSAEGLPTSLDDAISAIDDRDVPGKVGGDS